MRVRKYLTIVLLLFSVSPILAQGFFSKNNQEEEEPEEPRRGMVSILLPRKLIDIPTAVTLPRGSFDFDFRAYPRGGIFAAVDIGLTDWILIGVAYGGENLLGEGGVNWNPRVEFISKIRVVKESYGLPALVIGYDSQGSGAFNDSARRYTIKSKGFYAALSKYYYWGKALLGFHGGLNYSLETKDNDKNPDFYGGADLMFNDQIVAEATYDFAFNDDRGSSLYGKGRGYFDLALRWLYSETLQLEFQLKNLLQNRKGATTISREFRLIYVDSF